jgi:hypothetical protein
LCRGKFFPRDIFRKSSRNRGGCRTVSDNFFKKNFYNFIKNFIKNFYNFIKNFIKNFYNFIKNFIKNFYNFIKNFIKNFYNSIKNFIKNFYNFIKNFIKKFKIFLKILPPVWGCFKFFLDGRASVFVLFSSDFYRAPYILAPAAGSVCFEK